MTDTRCERCSQKKVGISDIIHAGHGDRYQVCKCFMFYGHFLIHFLIKHRLSLEEKITNNVYVPVEGIYQILFYFPAKTKVI